MKVVSSRFLLLSQNKSEPQSIVFIHQIAHADSPGPEIMLGSLVAWHGHLMIEVSIWRYREEELAGCRLNFPLHKDVGRAMTV